MKAAAKKTTDWIILGGVIKEDERDVYEFGLEKLFSSLVIFFFVLLLGLIFGIIFQAVVFYLAYIIIRVYAGGYHAEKPLTCYVASVIILIPCLVAIRFYHVWDVSLISWALLVVSCAILVAIAPVEHKKKLLDSLEKVVYRRRMLRNLAVASVGMITLAMLSLNSFSAAVLCGILLSAIMACYGKLKLRMQT